MSDNFDASTMGLILKKIVLTVVLFIVFIYLFMELYTIVTNAVVLTGNPVADGLIILVPMCFAFAVLYIMYHKYVVQDNEG